MSGCPDKDLHSIYIDGEFPVQYLEEYKAHVDSCPACTEELRKLRKISDLLKADSSQIKLDDAFLEESFKRLETKLKYTKNTGVNSRAKSSVIYSDITRWAVSFVAAAAVFAVIFTPLHNRDSAKNAAQLSVIQRTEIKPITETGVVIEGNLDQQAIAATIRSNQQESQEQTQENITENVSTQRVISATNLASSGGSEIIRSLGSIDVFRPDFKSQDEHR